MKLHHDVQELSAAATELYQQASNLEANGTPRTRDAADRLRAEARELLKQAETALRLLNAEASASQSVEHLQRCGEKLAKEVRYSADILGAMREAGTIAQIAQDMNVPYQTLEYHTAVAIRKHMDKAIRRRMVTSMKGLPSCSEDVLADEDMIKRLLLMGVAVPKIADRLRIDQKRVYCVLAGLTQSETVQRTVSVKARWRKKHEKIWELRKEGYGFRYIASRTGYTPSHVRKVIEGKCKISEDIRRAQGLKDAKA